MNLLTIPAGTAFLPALAAEWRSRTVDRGRALHDGLIMLPTRRAARALAAAFLDFADGRPMLLPRIIPIGGLDEAPLALAGALTLPPAITEPHRRAKLAQLILLKQGMDGTRRSDTAWSLAGDLALLMDEAERAEIDLEDGLRRAADPMHAEHWDRTLTFLQIVTRHWPDYLAEQGLMNPAARQVGLMDAQAGAWSATPPSYPVLAVSSAGDIPAVARLLQVIGGLPHGAVVLPGLDTELPDETWEQLDEAHPQFGLRALLSQLGAGRDEVVGSAASALPGRADLLRRALLPSAALSAWTMPFAAELEGVARLAPADPQEEAVCIALILRDLLEQPGKQAALVTPDRVLADRVAAELGRWGVVADDSAGEPMAQTPPAVFLRLIAAAVAQNLAPVPLLALLKHPMAGGGLAAEELRLRARLLERLCLRGPAPIAGLAGLRRAVDRARDRRPQSKAAEEDVLADLLARLEHCLEPLLRMISAVRVSPADLIATLVEAAEALAATEDKPGPARLWGGEEGEALAASLAEALEALPALPDDAPSVLPTLLDALLEGEVVRSRRATRGRAGNEHPRIFIWGLLEARLQTADVIVLGGLNEGVWPPATDPGPWMSRPMRASAGLPSPELRIGQAAHDFCMGACAAPRVVLSSPRRRDGAPATPARWLARLDVMLGERHALQTHPAAAWPALLDVPAAAPQAALPPRPCPPLGARPRQLAVTDIAALLRNPYEVYARRILRLKALEPLEQSTDFMDYGNIVHRGLDEFLRDVGIGWPDDAVPRIAQAMQNALRSASVREALIAWWSPRLGRIAEWVDGEERRRRDASPPVAVETEIEGRWTLVTAGEAFTLVGRADRIERRRDGRIAILDYKTGAVPTRKDAEEGRAPQLLLEAAMARAGAFGPDFAGGTSELVYWRLSGDHDKGKAVRLLKDATDDGIDLAVADAGDQLRMLIESYDDPRSCYPAQPLPAHPRHDPYAQLSRAAEWGAAEETGETMEGAEP